MKRLLFVSWYSGLGGGETDLLSLMETLDPACFERHLLLPREGLLAEQWRARAGQTYILPYRGASTYFVPALWARFPVVARFANFLQSQRIDLVHSDYHSLPLVAPAARRLGIPLMWTLWGWWFTPKAWQREFFRGMKTVARSQAIRAGFLGDPPFRRASELPVIYPGVDCQRFHSRHDGRQLRKELGLDEDAKVVAMAARFQRVKGHHTFQAMAERVLAEMPGAQFVVAGDETFGEAADQRYRDAILASAKSSAGLRENLRYIGFREDVESVYAAADVVVCASEFESFGKANIEAMACGKPVVSTRSGGPSETVLDGVSGYLVDSGDASAMAERVIELLGDSNLRAKMGLAGRQRVEESFSLEASTAAYSAIFEELLRLS